MVGGQGNGERRGGKGARRGCDTSRQDSAHRASGCEEETGASHWLCDIERAEPCAFARQLALSILLAFARESDIVLAFVMLYFPALSSSYPAG